MRPGSTGSGSAATDRAPADGTEREGAAPGDTVPAADREPEAGPAPARRRGGRVLSLCALVVALLLLAPGVVPDLPGRPGSLLETFLPWLGLTVPPLLAVALLRRSPAGTVAAALPALVWAGQFGPLLLPPAGAPHDFLALQHNVSDVNPDPRGTARSLVPHGADLIALEEVTPAALPVYRRELAARYPYHAARGTVGLWSAHPLTDVRALDIRPSGVGAGWNRGLRATVHTPDGELAAVVAHLPSVRIGPTAGFEARRRDGSARLLARRIDAEPLERLVLLGDLNGTVQDRGLGPVTSRLAAPERGFALSWPASLPVARIDQVLARAAAVTRIEALPATGSDHLPVLAHLRSDAR
ncbi:endonuclease/exonuclease/phosphatase family protein [uncultured Streptomyces sp.]|uniref:endonuclease/exonuclease/phosphatase family protein n=1 Tax=uncultured Streptomyces sp. TaxID=174707 RepID=UPI0026322A09|nr:endonuclease/exonuclease/phosphatase family protein [uncultured Streptomyces sp.]